MLGPRVVTVVAAALLNKSGRILIARRPEGKAMAGLWEFPGGKLEPGERPEAALVRELNEELGITAEIHSLVPLTFASHSYDDFHLLMPLYLCRRWTGCLAAREHTELSWVEINDLRQYPMPDADKPLIDYMEHVIPVIGSLV